MINRYGRIAAAAALVVGMSSSQAALVNLSGWTAQGGSSTWTVAPDNNSVFQSINGDPAVFFSGTNDRGLALSGKIKVETTTDDDFIGFVLGYRSGDITAASGQNYILIDWKQGDQSFFGCTAEAGLAISRVTTALPDGQGAWCHDSSFGVQELQRATTLGDTGWADNTDYSFDLVFTATNIQVKVNGQTELNINGSFQDGSFGFYNYSQQSVRYSALTQEVVPPPPPPPNGTPEPATLALLGLAFAGGVATRRRRR